MIAYEKQLRYVIRDKIRDKIQSEKKSKKKIFCQKKFCWKKLLEKNLSQMLSQISSAQSELSRTNRCLSSLSGIYTPQLGKIHIF